MLDIKVMMHTRLSWIIDFRMYGWIFLLPHFTWYRKYHLSGIFISISIQFLYTKSVIERVIVFLFNSPMAGQCKYSTIIVMTGSLAFLQLYKNYKSALADAQNGPEQKTHGQMSSPKQNTPW